jgi:hypothetical protein
MYEILEDKGKSVVSICCARLLCVCMFVCLLFFFFSFVLLFLDPFPEMAKGPTGSKNVEIKKALAARTPVKGYFILFYIYFIYRFIFIR